MASVDNNNLRTTTVYNSRKHVGEASSKDDSMEEWPPSKGERHPRTR